jgi:hypothetical protein
MKHTRSTVQSNHTGTAWGRRLALGRATLCQAGVYPVDDVAPAGESVADSVGTLAAPALTDLAGLLPGQLWPTKWESEGKDREEPR